VHNDELASAIGSHDNDNFNDDNPSVDLVPEVTEEEQL